MQLRLGITPRRTIRDSQADPEQFQDSIPESVSRLPFPPPFSRLPFPSQFQDFHSHRRFKTSNPEAVSRLPFPPPRPLASSSSPTASPSPSPSKAKAPSSSSQRRRPRHRPPRASRALGRTAGSAGPATSPISRPNKRSRLDKQLARPARRPGLPQRRKSSRYYEGFSQRRPLAALPLPARPASRSHPRLGRLPKRSTSASPTRRRALPAGRHHLGARLPAHALPGAAPRAPARRAHRLLPPHPLPRSEIFRILPWRAQLAARGCSARTSSASTRSATCATSPPRCCALLGHRAATSTRASTRAARARWASSPWASTPQALRARCAQRPEVRARGERDPRASARTQLLLGIDRLDYTKGIPRRLLAFERLLEREPALRGKRAVRPGGGARRATQVERLRGVPPRGRRAGGPHQRRATATLDRSRSTTSTARFRASSWSRSTARRT